MAAIRIAYREVVLEFTGERYIPGVEGDIAAEHYHRYVMARSIVTGLDVLDIASGEGYGAAMLAKTARSVVGIDSSLEAVVHARLRYRSGETTLRFLQGDGTSLPLADDSVDAVVSFETLEHLEDHDTMLSEMVRALRPQGFAVISTPNVDIYSVANNHFNPYHKRELDRESFAALLSRHFASVVLFAQTMIRGSLMTPLGSAGERACMLHGRADVESSVAASTATYFVAVCAQDPAALVHPGASLYVHS